MDIQQLNSIVNEQKSKANIINNLAIDFEHIRLTTPKIIYIQKTDIKPEIKDNAKFVLGLINNVETELTNLKDILTNIISE